MKINIKNSKIKKIIFSIISAVAVAALTVFLVTAYRSLVSEDKVNTVTSSKMNVAIKEDIESDTKEEIFFVADSDNTEDAYVRASLVAYWTALNDTDQIIIGDIPDLDDYINYDDWEKIEVPVSENSAHTNTYYEYKQPLKPGERTSNLLSDPITLTSDSNKKLEITVLLQAVDKETYEKGVWE